MYKVGVKPLLVSIFFSMFLAFFSLISVQAVTFQGLDLTNKHYVVLQNDTTLNYTVSILDENYVNDSTLVKGITYSVNGSNVLLNYSLWVRCGLTATYTYNSSGVLLTTSTTNLGNTFQLWSSSDSSINSHLLGYNFDLLTHYAMPTAVVNTINTQMRLPLPVIPKDYIAKEKLLNPLPFLSDSEQQALEQTKIDSWNFEGLKIKSPLVNSSINASTFTIEGRARINAPKILNPSFNEYGIVDSISKITSEFKKNLVVTIDGVKVDVVSSTVKYMNYSEPLNSTYYNLDFSFNLPVTKSGNVVVQIGSSFLIRNGNRVFFQQDEFSQYQTSRSFNFVKAIDLNGDGIDDKTDSVIPPSQVIKDSDMPDRSNYADGFGGDLAYNGDLLVYYITLPFRLIGSVFTTLIGSLTETVKNMGEVGGFVGAIFSFLPPQIIALLTVAMSFLVIGVFLRSFGRK